MATAGQFTQWYFGVYSMYPPGVDPRVGWAPGAQHLWVLGAALLPQGRPTRPPGSRGAGGGGESGEADSPPVLPGCAVPGGGCASVFSSAKGALCGSCAGGLLLNHRLSAAGLFVSLLEYPRGKRKKGSTMERW